MAAIDDLNAAVSKVSAYVGTLQADLASADMTPQIESATAALIGLVPAPPAPPPVAAPPPQIDPATGLPVV